MGQFDTPEFQAWLKERENYTKEDWDREDAEAAAEFDRNVAERNRGFSIGQTVKLKYFPGNKHITGFERLSPVVHGNPRKHFEPGDEVLIVEGPFCTDWRCKLVNDDWLFYIDAAYFVRPEGA